MPRAPRIEYPGGGLSRMNRGDRREPIFRDDLDRRRFLATLAEAHPRAREKHPASLRRETAEAKARRRLREELDALHWTAVDLAAHAKGDGRKVRIVQRLRAETSMTLKWIAHELHICTWTYLANRLRQTTNKVRLKMNCHCDKYCGLTRMAVS